MGKWLAKVPGPGSAGSNGRRLLTANGRRLQLWTLRLELAKALIERRIDLLLSDADAVWMRNPFYMLVGRSRTTGPGYRRGNLAAAGCQEEELSEAQPPDIIASRGR